MMIKHLLSLLTLCSAVVSCNDNTPTLNAKEKLGLSIFVDSTLSLPHGQSCASCHEVDRGFSDPEHRAISEGAIKGRFAKRNSPTVCYAKFVPPLSFDSIDEVWVGGLFWDGRVNSLAAQALEPFVDMLEMANSQQGIVDAVQRAPYFAELQQIYGTSTDADSIFAYITDALSAYQSSDLVSPFSSKYDKYIAGQTTLSPDEMAGLELFKNKGLCAECHPVEPDQIYGKILFTDHTYDNLGIPRNEQSPFYDQSLEFNPAGRNFVDLGLGEVLRDEAEYGKFRVPTLRNVELTAPYGHNGYFATLEEIVHFYNIRDVDSLSEFGAAEYPLTVNTEELGNLGLTPHEEQQIIAFLKTLTDESY